MRWINPYLEEGNWYKGNMHTHSKVSDGELELNEVISAYKRMGEHDFIVVTDHTIGTHPNKFTPITDLQEKYKDKQFTIIEGREESFGRHILGIGVPMIFDQDIIKKPSVEYTLFDYQKIINHIKSEGGLAYLPHPHWLHFDYWTAEQMLMLENVDGFELFNGDRFNGPANLASDVWDAVLSNGKQLFAVANDDFHNPATFLHAWNYVYAKSNSKEDILDALKHGSSYCSNGAEFEYIKVDGDRIIVECSHKSIYQNTIKFFRFVGKDGECLSLQSGKNGYAEYKAMGDETYIRVEMTLNWGMSAFTQAFFLEK